MCKKEEEKKQSQRGVFLFPKVIDSHNRTKAITAEAQTVLGHVDPSPLALWAVWCWWVGRGSGEGGGSDCNVHILTFFSK